MGKIDEFKTVKKKKGIVPALKWIGRDAATSVFHPASYRLIDSFSSRMVDQAGLEERLQDNGTIEYYDQDRTVQIELPAGRDHVEIFSERVGTYTIRQPFVGELRGVTLVGSYPIPIDRRNNVVLEAIGNPEVLTLNVAHSALDVMRNPWEKEMVDTDPIDSAVLLYNDWNRGYYHWTVEMLTRLEGVEKYREQTGESPKLIVGPDPSRFQLQTLALLGYDENDLIRWDCWKRKVDKLIVPSMRRELNPGTVSPIAYQWLRERMRTAAGISDRASEMDFSKRVYISREDAPRRRIVNEDEVLGVLSDYGFEKYVLSEHSVAENVQLFAQAETIVAPHGAGLTDIIYADDVTVIELFRSNDVRPSYYVLSEMLDHRYRYQLCDYEGPNLVVDPDQLESIVADEIMDGVDMRV